MTNDADFEKACISPAYLKQELEALALEQKPCTVDDAREDFMYDVYNILDFLPTNNEANQIIDVFDRVTKYMQEPRDCVSREAVLNTLDTTDKFLDEDRTVETYKALLEECYDVLPSAEPAHKKGKWIKGCTAVTGDGLAQTYDCSECGSYWYKKFNYCPNCGAEMEMEE